MLAVVFKPRRTSPIGDKRQSEPALSEVEWDEAATRLLIVIPAQAGIQIVYEQIDSWLRRNDNEQ